MAGESRAYLRAYARGQSSQPSRQEGESVEDYAARIGADPGPPPGAKPAPPAAPASAPNPSSENLPDEPAEPDTKPAQPSSTSDGKQSRSRSPWVQRVEDLRDRIAAAPTPGGIGGVLVILLLFVALIIPVQRGYTRAQLFWLTLLGRTALPSSGDAAQPSSSAPQTPAQLLAQAQQLAASGNPAVAAVGSIEQQLAARAVVGSVLGDIINGRPIPPGALAPLQMPGGSSQTFTLPPTAGR